MSFAITLQRNDSETNRLTKTITDLLTVTGTLKTETSIIDPALLIECDLTAVTGCNYLSIPTFGRSYFVNDIRSVRSGLVEFSCHVDVLSSFADEIRANKGIIKRQENSWNLYLNDGSLKIYQNPSVITKEFPNGFSGESFVLAVAGRISS